MTDYKNESKILIITGMHRSGTSLTASLLQSAGLHVGRQLMPGTEFNPKGHFENVDFFEFHLDLLRSQGVNVDGWTLQEDLDVPDEFIDKAHGIVEQNSLSSVWGWKEPRTTLFLDFWAELLADAKFLLIYRSPWDVIDSLYRRGDEIFKDQPELAVKYWVFYNQKILDFYNKYGNKCLLSNIETIIKNQDKYAIEINQKFGLDLTNPSPAVFDSSLLKTNVSEDGQRPSLIDYYFPEAIEMYQELESRGWHPDKTPDLSWNSQIKSSPYLTWAFRDWANYRRVEAENKSLKVELDQIKSQFNPGELEEANSLVEELRTQLHETEAVLEKSYGQLQKTESTLQESHSQLTEVRSQFTLTQEELEKAKSQLNQTQWDVMKYQSQLHQTQEELEQSELQNKQLLDHQNKLQSQLNQFESQLIKNEMMLSQARLQLDKFNKARGRILAQVHYTQEQLELSKSKQHEYLAKLEKLQKTEIQLSQSLLTFNQIEKKHQRTLVQLHQAQGNLESCQLYLAESQQQQIQYKNQLEECEPLLAESIEQQQEMEKAIVEYQAKLQETQEELKSSQNQLQQTQQELQQLQTALNKAQLEAEKLQFYKTVASSASEQSQEQKYKLFVWDAWCAYQGGDLATMAQCLQRSLKYSPHSKTETLSHWLENFTHFAKEKGVPFDTASLTSSEEWRQLMKRAIAVKSLVTQK